MKDKRALARKKKDWDSYQLYTNRYEALSDSLFNSSVSNRISMISSMAEVQKKNDEIELQKANLVIKENELKQSRVLVLLLSTGGGSFLFCA